MMKKKLPLFFTQLTFLFFSISLSSQTVYVDQDASGANNGTSWDNAYTDLSNALSSTTIGEIWIASGTYYPGEGTPDSSSRFFVNGAISLYGGFVGNETILSERDFLANQTTLSGDIAGDDVDNDFDANKTDNVQHVLHVDSLLNGTTIIDGFYINGGHTSDNNDQSEFFWRGGGIFSYSTIEVRNCSFSNNFARSGAAIYVSPNGGNGGDDSTFENCSFSENFASSQSSGIFVSGVSNITISNCEFNDNTTNRGVIYPIYCSGVAISDCTFNNNASEFTDGFGATIFNWNSTGITISNCSFIGNTGGNGGVMFHRGDENPIDNQNLVIEDCVFENNTATDFGGGALYVFSGSFSIDNCTFDDNLGTNGSHLFLTGENKDIQILNSTFDGGMSNFGAAHSCYGANSTFLLDNNTYTSGIAETSGGALIIGFKANVTINNCNFAQNSASFGGAIYTQNDSTFVNYSNCIFNSNAATADGGAIYQGGGIKGTYDQCQFLTNTADLSGGGIYAGTFNDDVETGSFDISNSIFNFNLSNEYGGALNLIDINSTVSNSLFTSNFIGGGGVAGGAISCNTSDDNTAEVNIVNNTFVDNSAIIGAGVSLRTGTVNSDLTFSSQNCIYYNLGPNFEIEDGSTPNTGSFGGNLSTDDSGVGVWTDNTDQNNVVDILFADLSSFNYRLSMDSPAVDAGVAAGAPTTDIEGNPRIGEVDSGAYEFDPTTNLFTPVVDNNSLTILSNPVGEVLNYKLENEMQGRVLLKIYDINGQLVKQWTAGKGSNLLEESINVKDMLGGVYVLFVGYENKIVTQKFIKQ